MEMNATVDTVSSTEIKTKMHFTGKVTHTTLAGAVIDLGIGIPGLLHISQVVGVDPTQPIKSIKDVLQEGQSVEVWVRKIKDDRLEVTMIKPLDLEWREIKKDMTVRGKVVRLEKFGAFVEIGAERPGLIHISEMAHGYVRQPSDVVNEGDEIEAMVIDVNRKKKQIKLSIKALQPEPVKEEEPMIPVDAAPRKEKAPRRRKPGKRERSDEFNEDISGLLASVNGAPEAEAEPTAMEIAWREAMERAKVRKTDDKGKKKAGSSTEQADILSRTLENKVQS